MKGSLIQLISKSSEDVYLTTIPQFSYFQKIYKRHTNFSMESIDKIITSTPTFNSTSIIKLPRYGEFISKIYLEVDLPYNSSSNAMWTNRVGYNLLKRIEFYIGDILIEKQYGLWMYIWSELSLSYDKHKMLDDLVGPTSSGGSASFGLNSNVSHKLHIPLNFYFCKNYALALPICSLLYQDMYIKIYFEEKSKCFQSGDFSLISNNIKSKLWFDYIFVEKQEALDFIQNDLEYLITIPVYHKKNLNSNGINNIPLPFSLPCKELIWVNKKTSLTGNADKFTDFTNGILSNSTKVFFYQNLNYGGWETQIGVGNYTNSDLLTLNASFNGMGSLKTNGLTVLLYTGNNFDGIEYKIEKDNTGDILFNDKVRSVKILDLNRQINILRTAQIKINSKNVFSSKDKIYQYFNYLIPYKYHTGNPPLGINSYPFCLYPENIGSSGILNLKLNQIKKFSLQVNCDISTIHVFGNCINFLEIKNNIAKIKLNY